MKPISNTTLKWGFISVGVKVYPIRDTSEDISLTTLCSDCNGETGLKRYCKSCGSGQKWITGVKGYRIDKQNIVKLTKEEIETIERGTSKIQVLGFVKAEMVDSATYDKPYFLEPSMNTEVYNALVKLLQQENKVILAKAIIKSSEHIAVLRHYGNGLLMQYVEKIKPIEIGIKKDVVTESEYALLKQLIDKHTIELDLDSVTFDYREQLKQLINDKLNGKVIEIEKEQIKQKDELLEESLKAMLVEVK